jgi:hypothetical protein
MVSTVTLYCKNSAGTTLQTYTLSPDAKVSRQIQKDNILAAIPFAGFLGIDMGLISNNVVTVSGRMTYDHNTRNPLTVLEEIANIAAYHDVTNTGVDTIDGKWMVGIGSTIFYSGTPYMINYDITSGEGGMINYTIQITVST